MNITQSPYQAILEIEGVQAVLVLSADGEILSAINLDHAKLDTFASMVSLLVSSASCLSTARSLGETSQLLIEYAGGKAFVHTVGDHFLTVFTAPEAVSGMIRLAVKSIR